MEGNASVFQVNYVGRITGEGRAEYLRAWGPEVVQEGAGGGSNISCRDGFKKQPKK